jgi:hemoglobin-like flavoprotein
LRGPGQRHTDLHDIPRAGKKWRVGQRAVETNQPALEHWPASIALAAFPQNVALVSKGEQLMLTNTQKTLVQQSFAAVAPIADDAAALFYRRLFELDPSLERMFKGDMTEQRRKLMQMLTAAVKGLDRLDQLVPVVEDLGRRHAGYGVADAHYDTVGAALLWTLEKGLGSAFTPEVEDAWIAVYGLLAGTMKNASKESLVGV